MLNTLKSPQTDLKRFHWYTCDNLLRDQEQSHLLHEPRFRIMTTDPISGNDVVDHLDHCSIVDGNLSIFFESLRNCEEYKNMPYDHPNLHLPYPACDEDDRGG